MASDDRVEARWERTIPDLFAVQRRKRPQATAVCFGGVEVTYAELDATSDRIARWLIAHGVGLDDVVAVRMERGHELISALLGIGKAGAGYLALDVDLPDARRDHLIGVAEAAAVIAGDGIELSAAQSRLPVLRLPAALAAVDLYPLPMPGTGPDGLAYVSFTSGSTGVPKGVAVPHRGVARLVTGGFADFGPDETFLLLSPIAFDASTLEIWACLLTGGRLVVHPQGPLTASALEAVLAKEDVTTAYLPAALFHQIVQHRPAALAGLHQLLVGGEALNPVWVDEFVSRYPQIRLVNGFGHTENTTFTLCHTVSEPVGAACVPVGRPINGTQVRVLDEHLCEVRPGDRGDLYASGAGLSRGYLKEPVATALAFRPDPFSERPGARMYRTGDLVRRREDGPYEFVGRSDHQLKVRGFRVDPREVERELALLPGIRHAAVVGRRDELGANSLVAYVITDPDPAVPEENVATGIRRQLRERLPAYMIPAMFVTLGEFPLTANGKVDTAALPVPQRSERQADAEYIAARTATEQMLCDVWADALKLDRVGVDDDIFDLGADSLLIIDLAARIGSILGIDLPDDALYLQPTVAQLTAALDEPAPQALGGRAHRAPA